MGSEWRKGERERKNFRDAGEAEGGDYHIGYPAGLSVEKK